MIHKDKKELVVNGNQTKKTFLYSRMMDLDESCFPDFNGNMNPDSWSPEIPLVLQFKSLIFHLYITYGCFRTTYPPT